MPFVDIGPAPKLEECYWYHSFDFPDGKTVHGDWDLRGRFSDYTGGIDLRGKRVLDVGTASGFLAFGAERAGARQVVSYDMPINGNWDTVPMADEPVANLSAAAIEVRLHQRRLSEATRYKRENAIARMRKGYFYAHRMHASQVRLFEGSVYAIDEAVGVFDVSIVGAILLHLRDPFLALHKIAQVTVSHLVIADLLPPHFSAMAEGKPLLEFIPHVGRKDMHAWWRLSRGALENMLRVVGFQIESSAVHTYKFQGANSEMQTVVARRIAV